MINQSESDFDGRGQIFNRADSALRVSNKK